MTEELQLKLVEWIQNLINGVSSELPSFIEEIVTYGFYSNLFIAITSLFLFCAGICIAVKLEKHIPKPKTDYDLSLSARKIIFFTISTVVLMIIFVSFLESGKKAMKAYLAPRAYVIDKYIFRSKG